MVIKESRARAKDHFRTHIRNYMYARKSIEIGHVRTSFNIRGWQEIYQIPKKKLLAMTVRADLLSLNYSRCD